MKTEVIHEHVRYFPTGEMPIHVAVKFSKEPVQFRSGQVRCREGENMVGRLDSVQFS
jgi:hypothetical protein